MNTADLIAIDTHKGKLGGREAGKLVEECGVEGFKLHPTVQGFDVTDRWLKDFAEVGFKDEVRPLTLKENAKRLLKLT